MSEVVLTKVVKAYGTTQVIHGVDLTIASGEFCVFVGPSGCGKSTLLRMIAGLEGITDGEVRIGGTVVNDLPPRDRDIAMVFQDYALYPHKTVFENMAFGLRLRKRPEAEIQQRVGDAAGILRIDHLLERKPGQLSGGQRQRVAMGRAIVRNPKAFLFDEPLSNLDAQLRSEMRVEINKLPQAPAQHGHLRDARPGRGDDAGRQDRRALGRPHHPGRIARRDLQPPGRQVRRRLHRLAADELPALHDRDGRRRRPA